jgi:hypothetical protein
LRHVLPPVSATPTSPTGDHQTRLRCPLMLRLCALWGPSHNIAVSRVLLCQRGCESKVTPAEGTPCACAPPQKYPTPREQGHHQHEREVMVAVLAFQSAEESEGGAPAGGGQEEAAQSWLLLFRVFGALIQLWQLLPLAPSGGASAASIQVLLSHPSQDTRSLHGQCQADGSPKNTKVAPRVRRSQAGCRLGSLTRNYGFNRGAFPAFQ